MLSSRRAFLGVAAALVGGAPLKAAAQAGLDQFGSSAPPCTPDQKLTPSVPADATFRRGSPPRTSLVETGMTGTKLMLTGTVAGLTCGRIKGAEIDFWQADDRGRYDTAGFRLRGHQLTSADGGYRLMTVVPGAPGGRARHLGIRVRVAGKPEFFTEAFFPNDPANARDPRFRPELVVTMTRAAAGQEQAATFDVVLDM